MTKINNIKNISMLSILTAVIAMAITAPSDSYATVTGGQVLGGSSHAAGGAFQLVAPPIPSPSGNCPPNSVGNNCQQTHDLWAFDEDQNIILPANLPVNDINGDGVPDVASLPAGTQIASHYVYYDPVQSNTIQGCVNFDSKVLATIFVRADLITSDILANTGVNYLSPGARGFELANDIAKFGAANVGSDNRVCVSFQAATPGDYFRVLTEFSPGGVIDVEKSWTFTDYNWDPVCIETDIITNPDGTTTKVCIAEELVNIEDEGVLAGPLPHVDGNMYVAHAQVHSNGKYTGTNPGAFYALTTVEVNNTVDGLWVDEIYGECTNPDGNEDTDDGILDFVSKKVDRNVKVALADPNGDVTELTDDLYDTPALTADLDSATVHIEQTIEAGSTVYVLVKFQDNSENIEVIDGEVDVMCDNVENVAYHIDDLEWEEAAAASLRITNLE